ncbi:MAG: molecular chaperone [Planctomycetota bacterium]
MDDVEKIRDRSQLYQFFAILFMYPAPDNLKILQDEILPELNSRMSVYFHPQICNSLTSIINKLTLHNWEKLYTDTFGHTTGDIPLYETRYFPDNVFSESQRLADICAFYRAFKLKVSHVSKEKPDHISVELEFIAFLLQKILYAILNNNDEMLSICQNAVRKFFNEHLFQWGYKFCDKLIQFSKNELYKTAGTLCKMFLASEYSCLKDNI